MEDSDKLNLEQIRAFLEGSQEVGFQALHRAELYDWVQRTLGHHDYPKLERTAKGLVRRFVAKMTGLSRAQTTRLIGAYQKRDRKSTRLNSSHPRLSRMPSSA